MIDPNYSQVLEAPRVAILAYDGLATFEFSCAVELFSLPRPETMKWYQTDIVAVESGSLNALGGFKVECDHVFSEKEGFNGYDMIVIPGWNRKDKKRIVSGSLRQAIIKFHKKGGTLLSFCSGAFALADCGLLDKKTATTHWLYEEEFRRNFPKIKFLSNVLYTGEDRIYTAAGSASGLDLGIHIIGKDYGIAVANKVAKRLVIAPQRQGGQSQYANQLNINTPTNHLNHCLEWALNNLDKNITIDDMANHGCISRRSFDRKFRKELGMSPKKWLTKQRINRAREYLENSSSNIEIIAEKSGLGSSMNMRHHFSKLLGVSPTHYRKQFLQN